jgi:predicted nucleic acid-binding protein
MVVSNATPLIYLAKASHLSILRKTYGDVYVCTDVWREVTYHVSSELIPKDVPIILQARGEGWLKVGDVKTEEAKNVRDELLSQGFGKGESNSIALAKELNTLLLANDEAAIMAARRYGVETGWVTEILHDALKYKHIKSVEEYVRILDACIAEGLHVSRKERERAIEAAKKIVQGSVLNRPLPY